MSVQLPPCPTSLRAVQHYLKTALEHDGRDPVISYWCRLYALQSALKIDKKSNDAKVFLMSLMQWLEEEKKRLSDNEAITNDIAAQAHIENYALRVFLWADSQDRAAIFNKNVVKAFYSAAMLMDVLQTFGELSEEIQKNSKYSKWKAAYIHNCLKNGETPVPGPLGGEEGEDEAVGGLAPTSSNPKEIGFEQPRQPPAPSQFDETRNFNLPMPPSTNTFSNAFPNIPTNNFSTIPVDNSPTIPSSSSSSITPSQPGSSPVNTKPNAFSGFVPYPSNQAGAADGINFGLTSETGIKLTPAQISKAQKYCKFASSALNYDDITEAVSNLTKALRLLQTGEDT
uniref:Vta1/callose synthase N-terminal domain-containing protein n=1 Tax=Clastoptera arizonana TaxID=38151 RepID=A0A1B6DCH3_9HEMI